MNPIKEKNSKASQKLIKALKSRQMDAYFCEDANEAVKKVIELISPKQTVAFGGSATLQQTGILDAIKAGDYNLLDRANPALNQDVARESFFADSYLMSANAITLDGEIVNIDGLGNRCAALIFGPKNVIIVAGMNKVVNSLDDALSRAKHIAAPTNAQRFEENKNPCLITGVCSNCKGEGCICIHTVITRLSRPKNRIKVILINDNFGF